MVEVAFTFYILRMEESIRKELKNFAVILEH